MSVNYGLIMRRFNVPMLADAKIRGRFTLAISGKREDGRAQTTWNRTLEREGGGEPAMVPETIIRHCF